LSTKLEKMSEKISKIEECLNLLSKQNRPSSYGDDIKPN